MVVLGRRGRRVAAAGLRGRMWLSAFVSDIRLRRPENKGKSGFISFLSGDKNDGADQGNVGA
jgi:hypothetical protein